MDVLRDNFNKILHEAEERKKKTLESFKKDLANIRSTRASTAMLDHVLVDYYGTHTPLKQLASITVPESRMIVINPFDKGSMGEIERAIHKSDLGISPQNDGTSIRLIMPEMSTERRHELVKQLKHRLEEARVSLRNIRRDTNEEIKKQKGHGASEDDLKDKQDEVQKLTDRYTKTCEDLAHTKEQSILTV